jgi:formylglycine-generating enzyme required for sulfatase activity
VMEFCRKLTERERAAGRLDEGHEYTLPTEAQWGYACRAGTTTRFSFGDDPEYSQLGDYGWFSGNSSNRTHDVGGKLANPWGLYDMHGNVWEWCQDWYGNYSGGSEPSIRVLRGGSWIISPRHCRSANRSWASAGVTNEVIGFRVALVAVP